MRETKFFRKIAVQEQPTLGLEHSGANEEAHEVVAKAGHRTVSQFQLLAGRRWWRKEAHQTGAYNTSCKTDSGAGLAQLQPAHPARTRMHT